MNEVKRHNGYGVSIKPTTGVYNYNQLEWIHDDMMNGIDIGFEEHKAECPTYEKDDYCDCMNDGPTTYLIGYRKNKEGEFEPDPEAEYSAICGEMYVQVVASKYMVESTPCSPCYPEQVEPSKAAGFYGFCPPPNVCGDECEFKDRIIPVK